MKYGVRSGLKAAAGVMAFSVVMASAVAYGADATLSVDVASAYVFRGATFNDGLNLQPGMEVSGPGGLSVGAWGVLDLEDYDGAVVDGQFQELDLYASYALPVEILDLSIGYTEYLYPSAGGDSDREVGVSIGKSVMAVDLAADVYYGLDGGIRKQFYVELSAGTEFELGCLGVELGAMVAYLNPDEGESGFSHWAATVGASYGAFGASVTYIGQVDDKVLPDSGSGGGYDVDVVGMLSASVAF